MTFTTDTFARAAFKRLYGLAQTSNSFDPANETLTSSVLLASQDILATSVRIPSVPATAVSNNIAVAITCKVEQINVLNGNAYRAKINGLASSSPLAGLINPLTGSAYADNDIVGNFLPPNYGVGYQVILFDGANPISPVDGRDWFFDYKSGIIFSEDPLTLGSTGTIQGYVFIGETLTDSIYRIKWDLNGSSLYNTNPGNVGIGTSSPASPLSINSVGSSSNPSLRIGSGIEGLFVPQAGHLGLLAGTSINILPIGNETNPSLYFGTDTNTGLFSPGDGKLSISTNGTEHVHVEFGRVGIGTSAPDSSLHVVDSTLNTGDNILHLESNLGNFTSTANGLLINIGTLGGSITGIYTGANIQLDPSTTTSGGSPIGYGIKVLNGLRTGGTTLNLGTMNGAFGGFFESKTTALISPSTRYGAVGSAENGNANIGFLGKATPTTGGNFTTGVWGAASGAAIANVGVYATIGSNAAAQTTANVSAALLADNKDASAPIMVARDNSVEVFRIADGGNVGIGTTIPLASLHLYKSSAGTGSSATIENASSSAGSYASLDLKATAGAIGSVKFYNAASTGSNALELTTNGAFPVRIAPNSVETARFESGGQVGIGTTSPNSFLHIYTSSDTSVIGNQIFVEAANSGSNSSPNIAFRNAGPSGTGSNKWMMGIAGDSSLGWFYGSTMTAGAHSVLLSRNSGNGQTSLGIKSDEQGFTNPSTNLQELVLTRRVDDKVSGVGVGIGFRIDGDVNNTIATNAAINCIIRDGSTTAGELSGDLQFLVNNNNSVLEAMRINANGFTGIGTSSPIYNLHVGNGSQVGINSSTTTIASSSASTSSSAAFLALAFDGAGTPNKVEGQLRADGVGTKITIGSSTNHTLEIRTNNIPRISVIGTGQVGIGTSTTTSTLAVRQTTAGDSIIKAMTTGGFLPFTLPNDMSPNSTSWGSPLMADASSNIFWGGPSKILEYYDDFVGVSISSRWQSHIFSTGQASLISSQTSILNSGVLQVQNIGNSSNSSSITGFPQMIDSGTSFIYFEALVKIPTLSSMIFDAGLTDDTTAPVSSSGGCFLRSDPSVSANWIIRCNGINYVTNIAVRSNKWNKIAFSIDNVTNLVFTGFGFSLVTTANITVYINDVVATFPGTDPTGLDSTSFPNFKGMLFFQVMLTGSVDRSFYLDYSLLRMAMHDNLSSSRYDI